MKGIVVHVVVKSWFDGHNNKDDEFSGSPEQVVSILYNKYCKHMSFLDKMYKALEIAEKEADDVVVKWRDTKQSKEVTKKP